MNNIIDVKQAAEKLSISQLRALRSWISDRIGQLERQAKQHEKNSLTSEERGTLDKAISKLKTVITILILIILFTACTKEVTPKAPDFSKFTKIYSFVDTEGFMSAWWEYPDGRIGGTDFTDRENIPVLVQEQKSWPKCTRSECKHVTQQGECWRHRSIQ